MTNQPMVATRFSKDTLICKRYETTTGGYVFIEYKLHFRILWFLGYVTPRRIMFPIEGWRIEPLKWNRSVIFMSGVAFCSLEDK